MDLEKIKYQKRDALKSLSAVFDGREMVLKVEYFQ